MAQIGDNLPMSENDYVDLPIDKYLSKTGRIVKSDMKLCIICRNSTDEKLTEAGDVGLKTLRYHSNLKEDNLLMKVKSSVFYHKSTCYKRYTRKRLSSVALNVPTSVDANADIVAVASCSKIPTRSSSSKVGLIDWKKCFFCKKDKREKCRQVSVTSSLPDTIYHHAQIRSDFVMLALLQTECLKSRKASYHGNCLSLYIKHDKAIDSENWAIDNAFDLLLGDITEPLKQGIAFKLNALLTSMRRNMQINDGNSYTAQKLQRKLLKHFGDTIFIHTQSGQGKSNIVLSSDLTLSKAIEACSMLNVRFKPDSLTMESDHIPPSHKSDESILHEAVGILRREIQNMPVTTEYHSVQEMSLAFANSYVPPLLKKTLVWLLNSDAYTIGITDPAHLTDHLERRVLNIAQCLIYCSRRKVLPPFHQGLAIQMYHTYGKRGILDTLSAHGLCMSYDELRRFITSAGKEELRQIETGTYIPYGLVNRYDGGQLVQEGDDNLDINCKTIDGKGTMHSMARVVFQNQNQSDLLTSCTRIPVQPDTSLKLNESTSDILIKTLPFRIPTPIPLPPRRSESSISRLYDLSKSTGIDDRDLTWVLLRMATRDTFTKESVTRTPTVFVPFWTGYYASQCESQTTLTIASYPPMIDAKPSDPSTIYTTMIRCLEMTNHLGQKNPIQSMDQQLYSVAQQVKWSRPIELNDHILRLGGFHAAGSFISSIGKIWGDAGLKEWLVESEVYAKGTVDMMLIGKQFHRAVRGLTLAFEVLLQAQIGEFFKWCRISHRNDAENVVSYINDLIESKADLSNSDVITALTMHVNTQIETLFQEFKHEKESFSVTFKFWSMFLSAVQVLLGSIRAEREGDWFLHLRCHSQMLPYYFVTNHCNYSRWMPVYLLDMFELPEEVLTKFLEGQFVIRRTAGAFNGIWSDMGTECTVIKDAKGDSGIIGLTSNKSAMIRWTLTRNVLGEYTRAMKEQYMFKSCDKSSHEQTKPAMLLKDEQDARTLSGHLYGFMSNPFDTDISDGDTLINIASGAIAPDEVKQSLTGILEDGNAMMKSFIESCLSENGTKNFFSAIKRSKLKTFSDIQRPTKVIIDGKRKMAKLSAEEVFRRAFAISKVRDDVTMESVLKYPLVSTPPSLFHDDGSMRKTTKSDLLHCLENILPEQRFTLADVRKNTSNSVFIRDAMAEFHSISPLCKTFEDVAEDYVKKVIKYFDYADTVIDVFDQYDNPNSVKAEERKRRQLAVIETREYQILPKRKLPVWDNFMALGKNKKALTNYICKYICEHLPTQSLLKNTNKRYLLAGGFTDGVKTVSVSEQGSAEVPSLNSTHEEADCRMIFHAVMANKTFDETRSRGTIFVKSADTDVLVLAINIYPYLEYTDALWMYMGKRTKTSDQRRLVPAHEISFLIGNELRQALPSIHALTGCDSVSSLTSIGKRTAWKVAEHMMTKGTLPNLDLGSTENESSLRVSRQFVAHLYGDKGNTSDLDNLRASLAKKCANVNKLPPCEDSFVQHVLRATLQCKIWASATEANPQELSPEDFGWTKEGNEWCPVMFTGPSASEMLDKLLCSCSGRHKQCLKNCSCREMSIGCTSECNCKRTNTCQNEFNNTDVVVEQEEESYLY